MESSPCAGYTFWPPEIMCAKIGAVASYVVEAAGLTKRFGEVEALRGVDLKVERGQVYGLLGPNGSGKTTLIRTLLGLLRPSSGESRLFGIVMPNRKVVADVGYMPQAEALYPEMTAEENLTFFARLCGGASRARIGEMLEV